MEKVAHGIFQKHRQNRRDPFHILDNPRSLKEARQTFRKLALLLHPDKCAGQEQKKTLCEEAFKIVNNAFKKIEAEYGEEDSSQAAEPCPRAAAAEPAVSPTEVAAARNNWNRTGRRAEDVCGEKDKGAFTRTPGTENGPIGAGGKSFGFECPRSPPSPARKPPRVLPRWNKENFGPVSADQVKAARKNWGEPSTSSASGHFDLDLSKDPTSINLTPLVDVDYEILREDDVTQKRSIGMCTSLYLLSISLPDCPRGD